MTPACTFATSSEGFVLNLIEEATVLLESRVPFPIIPTRAFSLGLLLLSVMRATGFVLNVDCATVVALFAKHNLPWPGEVSRAGHLQRPRAVNSSPCFSAGWQFSIVSVFPVLAIFIRARLLNFFTRAEYYRTGGSATRSASELIPYTLPAIFGSSRLPLRLC